MHGQWVWVEGEEERAPFLQCAWSGWIHLCIWLVDAALDSCVPDATQGWVPARLQSSTTVCIDDKPVPLEGRRTLPLVRSALGVCVCACVRASIARVRVRSSLCPRHTAPLPAFGRLGVRIVRRSIAMSRDARRVAPVRAQRAVCCERGYGGLVGAGWLLRARTSAPCAPSAPSALACRRSSGGGRPGHARGDQRGLGQPHASCAVRA